MKKINKLQIIFLISTVVVTSGISILSYQENKDDPRYQTQLQRFANETVTYLTDSSDLDYIADINSKTFSNNDILLFDPSFNRVSYNSNSCSFELSNDDYFNSFLKIDYISSTTLEEIVDYIKNLANNQEEVNITLNYDLITGYKIIVNDVTYLKINDRVFISGQYDNIITATVNHFNTDFFVYSYYGNFNTINYYDYRGTNEYLKKFCKDVVDSKKYDENGFYSVIKPNDAPIEDYYIIEENSNTINYQTRICFQSLSLKYSNNVYQSNESNSNYDDPLGYLVWYEYQREFYNYSFINYITEHYYYYLIMLTFTILMLYLLRNKNNPVINKTSNIVMPPLSKELPDIQPTELDMPKIDLESLINDIINNSRNLLTLKKIKINFVSSPSIINGNQEIINQLINDLYFLIIKCSNSNDIITITLENNSLTFYNPNLNFNEDNIKAINTIIKNISYHQSFKIIEHGYSINFK